MVNSKLRRLGRPNMMRLSTSLSLGMDRAASSATLSTRSLPWTVSRFWPPKRLMLELSLMVKSPLMVLRLPRSMSSATPVARAMLPEKVVQVAMAVASPPFSMVAVPEALQAAGEGCQWDWGEQRGCRGHTVGRAGDCQGREGESEKRHVEQMEKARRLLRY